MKSDDKPDTRDGADSEVDHSRREFAKTAAKYAAIFPVTTVLMTKKAHASSAL